MTDVPDMNALLQQAMAMQQQLLAAQAEAAAQTVEGSAAGGLVTVTLSGGGEALAVGIDPEVVDPDDVELLEDLVLAALRDALAKVQELQQRAMGGLGLGGAGGVGGLLGQG
jgi:DNA-binding YbaB/EbfC family protein